MAIQTRIREIGGAYSYQILVSIGPGQMRPVATEYDFATKNEAEVAAQKATEQVKQDMGGCYVSDR